jgi:hypothetical protein
LSWIVLPSNCSIRQALNAPIWKERRGYHDTLSLTCSPRGRSVHRSPTPSPAYEAIDSAPSNHTSSVVQRNNTLSIVRISPMLVDNRESTREQAKLTSSSHWRFDAVSRRIRSLAFWLNAFVNSIRWARTRWSLIANVISTSDSSCTSKEQFIPIALQLRCFLMVHLLREGRTISIDLSYRGTRKLSNPMSPSAPPLFRPSARGKLLISASGLVRTQGGPLGVLLINFLFRGGNLRN